MHRAGGVKLSYDPETGGYAGHGAGGPEGNVLL